VKELLLKYRELIAEIEQRLAQAGLQEAVPILQAATEIDSLDASKPREEFFAELNHRAALLLGLKCLVATHLREGEAPGEWPPDEDSTPPIQVKKTGRK
jgi:hypothetical protein